jgi:endonuclease YncB( thermonuclease family)
MKKYLSKMILLIVLAYLLLDSSICIANNLTNVTYIDAYDGDTFTINLKNLPDIFGKSIPVRVAHIDTAEIKSNDTCEVNAAIKARELTRELLKKAKSIELQNVKRDKYFRILADVNIDGSNLATKLLNENLAYPYEGEAKKKINWCIFLKKKKGLH